MVRFALVAFAMLVLLEGSVWAETIALTRTNNGDEQTAESSSKSSATGTVPPYEDIDPQIFDNDSGVDSVTTTTSVQSVVGFNTGEIMDVTTATCNTVPTAASYAPNVAVVTGGPMIVAGAANKSFAGGSGIGKSDADFVVGNPTDPNAVLVLTGTITIVYSPGAHTTSFSTSTVQIGDSTITCSAFGGCTGVIKDINVPGGQYTVSSPAGSGGTWNISQYVTKGSSVHMKAAASYYQGTSDICSEYPDFNVAATMSVNTQ